MKITIESVINAPLEKVWKSCITPADIMVWNRASPQWHCPDAEVDAVVGGIFRSRMESVDGSMGFDFVATFTALEPYHLMAYRLDDGRMVEIRLLEDGGSVKFVQTFDAETENSIDMQRSGWQSILNNFKRHVESKP